MSIERQFDYGMIESALADQDLESYPIWVWDAVHCMPAFPPLSLELYLNNELAHCTQYACEMLSVPLTKGWDAKHLNGHTYMTVIESSGEEAAEREKLFRERMSPFVEDPAGGWARDREEAMGLYRHMQDVDIERVSLLELEQLFSEAISAHRRIMEIHMIWMYALYSLDWLFGGLCEELTGITRDNPIHHKLRSGFDNMVFKSIRETWVLGRKAADMGLGDLFLAATDDEQLMSELQGSDAGRKWLKEYQKFLHVYGWRCEHLWDWSTRSWIEQPSLGLADVRRAVATGGDIRPDVERERLTGEREQATKELLAMIPQDQKEWFEKLLGVAQMSGSWSEDHTHYLDFPIHATGHKVFVEIGKRFAQAGVIDEPFDIFCLLPGEIDRNIMPMGRFRLHDFVKERKQNWQRVRLEPPIPFLGDVEKLGGVVSKDAVLRVEAAPPAVRPELKADLYGGATAPGVAEGTARVIMSEAQLAEVQLGEILVCPCTSAPWVPVFNIVKGVVTDMGGVMAHAVIVGREYGLPVVAATMEATTKIKSGDQIRVDGNLGAVYILSQKA